MSAADVDGEEDVLIAKNVSVTTRKKGGRPKGTTNDHSRAQELARCRAVNFVAVEYAMHLEEAEKVRKRRLEFGIRAKLVKRAIQMFGIEGEFDAQRMTIYNRIKKDWLEV